MIPPTFADLVNSIIERRQQILEEFTKAWIAENGLPVRDLCLIEEMSADGLKVTWRFEKAREESK